MTLPALAERFGAIRTLQSALKRHTPGSYRHDVIEGAIALALGERRRIDQYLIRNVLRDSQRLIRRAAAAVHLEDIGAVDDQDALAVSHSDTPEALAIARSQAEHFLRAASTSGQASERVLTGVLIGETLQETADAIGRSTTRVFQLRELLKLSAVGGGEQ